MPHPNNTTNHKGIVAGVLTAAMFLTMGSTAWASPDMGMGMDHHGFMGGHDDHCQVHHEMRGDSMHAMHPHNAAKHFINMASDLNLTNDQINKLTRMRDDYIEKNATAEQQLKAANSDLARTLYADSVDTNAANALIDKISKLNSQLWHSFAKQLHDIKAMLTDDQKKALEDMWQHEPHMMRGPGHDDMPHPHMAPGNMPMHRDMR
jgi:Spy/CpxP family protein refolding chaperone